MSLTKKLPTQSSNPASKFIECKAGGKQGYFQYYKKNENGEGGENIKVDFTKKGFFVLDNNLQSVGGYNEKNKAAKFQIIGNEVRVFNDDGSLAHATIKVMGYPLDKQQPKFVIAEGTWKEIKEAVEAKEGHFVRPLYSMDADGELILIKLSGAAYSSFLTSIEDKKQNTKDEAGNPRIHGYWIRVKEKWEEKTNGQTDYLVPQFEWGDKITQEEYDKAAELDTKLQTHLESYFKRGTSSEAVEKSGSAGGTPATEEPSFDIKNWRNFREAADQLFLGDLPMGEILRIKERKEELGRVDTVLYECLGQAAYDYQQLLKTGSWKEEVDKGGKKMGDYTLPELKAKLKQIEEFDRVEVRLLPVRQSLEAAIQTRTKEIPVVEGKAKVLEEEEESPF